jgi:hypothetical protein
MKRPLRVLRWAVSIVAFTACLLMGVLWVRSYWRADQFVLPLSASRAFMAVSLGGATSWRLGPWRPNWSQSMEITSVSPGVLTLGRAVDWMGNLRNARFSRESMRLPHWMLILACALIGAAPWMRWRFSVRGVLVLMVFLAAMFAILIFE